MASIDKRENGTYRVRVYVNREMGRQKIVSRTFKPRKGASKYATEKELKKFACIFEEMVRSGMILPGNKQEQVDLYYLEMTVETFIRQFYYDRISKKLSPNTVKFYRSVSESFIIPSFGKLRLADVEQKHFQSFVDFLSGGHSRADIEAKEPLSPATVRRYATVFQSVMTEAVKLNFIDESPFSDGKTEFPEIVKQKLQVYSEEESAEFIKALRTEEPMIQCMLGAAILLGLRRAEIVALKWEDIDFNECCVHIQRSAYKLKNQKQGIKLPKSRSGIRDVFFSDLYKNMLLLRKEEQEKDKQSAGKEYNDEDYIFTNTLGEMISVYTPTRVCAKFEEKHGFRHLKLHGLRHTCGSLLMANHVDAETVRDTLGHDNIKTTEIYLHPLKEHKKNAAAVLTNAILSAGKEKNENQNTNANCGSSEE